MFEADKKYRRLIMVALMTIAHLTFGTSAFSAAPVLVASQGDDPSVTFYVWDKDVPRAPGQLLRQEPLEDNVNLANASKGVRILYSTTNPIDNKETVVTSGAIFIPKGPKPEQGWPIIAWAHGTTGVNDACAPSRNARTERDAAYLNAWLAQGYAVVAADYIGLGTAGGHAWMAVPYEGYGVLDSIRAATSSFKDLSSAVVIVGQSQGGHAALAATALQPGYAPDIDLKATVATGVPGGYPFVPGSKPTDPVPAWAFAPGNTRNVDMRAIATYFAIFPDSFNPSDYLSEAAMNIFSASRVGCDPANTARLVADNGVTGANWLRKSLDEMAAKTVPFEQYPTLKFSHPLFVGSGLSDITVLPTFQYSVMASACREGTVVQAFFYAGENHGSTVNASLKDSAPFVRKAFSGEKILSNCQELTPPIADAPAPKRDKE